MPRRGAKTRGGTFELDLELNWTWGSTHGEGAEAVLGAYARALQAVGGGRTEHREGGRRGEIVLDGGGRPLQAHSLRWEVGADGHGGGGSIHMAGSSCPAAVSLQGGGKAHARMERGGRTRGGDNVWPLIKGWECWCGEVYLSL